MDKVKDTYFSLEEEEEALKRESQENQEIKADFGKPRLTLVPAAVIRAIARIREYGVKKYGEKESWKQVAPERYRDAMFRHLLAYIEDPYGVDEESGLPHLWHLACNVAFLCELDDVNIKIADSDRKLKEMADAYIKAKYPIPEHPMCKCESKTDDNEEYEDDDWGSEDFDYGENG